MAKTPHTIAEHTDFTLSELSNAVSDQDVVGDLDSRLGQGNNTALGQWEWKTGGDPDTDPTGGFMQTLFSGKASVTDIQLDDIPAMGVNIGPLLATLQTGDWLIINQASDLDDGATYTLTGPPVDKTGWWTIPVNAETVAGVNFTATENYSLQVVKGPAARATIINQHYVLDIQALTNYFGPLITDWQSGGSGPEDPPSTITTSNSALIGGGHGATGWHTYNDPWATLNSGTEATAAGSLAAYHSGFLMTSAGVLRKFVVSGYGLGGAVTITACPFKITGAATGALLHTAGVATAIGSGTYTAGTVTTANQGTFAAGDRIGLMFKTSTLSFEALVDIALEVELV